MNKLRPNMNKIIKEFIYYRTLFRRAVKEGFVISIVDYLYKKYVNRIYIPMHSNIHICRNPMVYGKDWGKISHIRFGFNKAETYCFHDFNNITEDENGILYISSKANNHKIDYLHELQNKLKESKTRH